MNTEFERNQITRKGVFVKSKRFAPQPPKTQATNADSTTRAYPTYSDTPVRDTKPSVTATSKESGDDGLSLAMLDRLEKQINRLEFDTKMAPKETKPIPSTNAQLFKKPVQYTGLESLLNTGVSNVATEHGIGYFEKDSIEEAHDTNNEFIRNANGRQSLGGHGNLVPPMSRPSRPVVRTSSDTDQMKELAITKQTLKQRRDAELINNALTTTNKTISVRDKKHVDSGDNNKTLTERINSKQMPTDVRKYIEAKLATKVMVMVNKGGAPSGVGVYKW